MKDKDPPIKKAMPAKRDAECLRAVTDIVIPRGTILRRKDNGHFSAAVGPDGEFLVAVEPGQEAPEGFRKVIAA